MTKNISVSNRAKLLNISRQTGQSFQELVQYFAMSRFLYRLAVSDSSPQFILKGAMLLHARHLTQARSTLDIDLLGKINNSSQSIRQTIEHVIAQNVENDGLEFLANTIDVSEITKESGYVGRRVNFRAMLDSILIPMQIDIGFGDKVIPEPSLVDIPTLLGYPSAKIYGYAFETSIAEKAHVMMQRELLNSRMKDFYDIWLLSQEAQISESILVDSIVGTFKRRGSSIELDSVLFTDEFINDVDKQKQWVAFCRRRGLTNAPEEFSEIATAVLSFLKPVLQRARVTMNNM